MRCLIGVGSNLGDRKGNLEASLKVLNEYLRISRVSPLVQTSALVPEGSPGDWQLPFLNGVVEAQWDGNPYELLSVLQSVEKRLGRTESPRWAPRVIDLDLLTFGEHLIQTAELTIPHAEMARRQFVLGPLKHLCPSLKIPGSNNSMLDHSRELSDQVPLWMGILNLTSDSFSDGGQLFDQNRLESRVALFESEFTPIYDLGGESTRPGATPVSAKLEWERLQPALRFLNERWRKDFFRPWISVDTYRAETARKSIEIGADIINDVSGLSDPDMIPWLAESACQYVLMHSLGVPASPSHTLSCKDPVLAVKEWAVEKLTVLEAAGISMDRILFDPGVGFGKTAAQSLAIIQRIDEFFELPVRILVGHSRKSFLCGHVQRAPNDRDLETLGVSLRLADRGVDVLRVHEPHAHSRAHFKFQEANRVLPIALGKSLPI